MHKAHGILTSTGNNVITANNDELDIKFYGGQTESQQLQKSHTE